MAFSKRLCNAVLGEDLKLPNVATWWCGEPDSLDFVIANLDRLFIQPAFRRRGHDRDLRNRLLSMSREQLIKAIRTKPTAFAAQERVNRSTVPVWGRTLRPARMAIRGYAVSAAGEYEVMDGGLGRITESLDPLELSIKKGEKGKDVWIHSQSARRICDSA